MLLLITSLAFATDPVDIGVLKDKDVKVVQKRLYSKEERVEVGAALGVLPFDGYTIAPTLALNGGYHLSETLGFGVRVAGGYGLKSRTYKELESSTYGVAVEAYRYVAGLEAIAEWTPIYAKANFLNRRIFHYDIYGLGGAGISVEQSLLPLADLAFVPTFPVGIGTRFYASDSSFFRIEYREGLMIEKREQSGTTAFKRSTGINVGYTKLLKKQGR